MDFQCVIMTPTTGFIRSAYTASLANLLLHCVNHNIYAEGGMQSLAYDVLESSGICSAREHMVAENLERFPAATHLCFIDEDIAFGPDTLATLARRRVPIVGVNYPFRKKGGSFTAFSAEKRSRVPTRADATGIERVSYTGFGFCLIERSVFSQIPKPWFYMAYGAQDDSYGTEDGWFGYQAMKCGVPWYVDHDASKSIRHIGTYEYSWEEVTT